MYNTRMVGKHGKRMHDTMSTLYYSAKYCRFSVGCVTWFSFFCSLDTLIMSLSQAQQMIDQRTSSLCFA